MSETLRELLIRLDDGNADNYDDDDLEALLKDDYPRVWVGDYDKHRWRIEYNAVTKIEGRFFKYTSFISRAECDSGEACGYEFEGVDNVIEVFPHDVTTIEYRQG